MAASFRHRDRGFEMVTWSQESPALRIGWGAWSSASRNVGPLRIDRARTGLAPHEIVHRDQRLGESFGPDRIARIEDVFAAA